MTALVQLLQNAKSRFRSHAHDAVAQRTAGLAFLIRIASAVCVFLLQILFARWMGGYEFGIYVFAWTLVLLGGEMVHLGLASVAQKFMPEYGRLEDRSLQRGFVSGSCGIVFATGAVVALLAAATIFFAKSHLGAQSVMPLYFACAALPAYALSLMLDGISRSYNWAGLALLPQYMLRPAGLIMLMAVVHHAGYPAGAGTGMALSALVVWGATAAQAFFLRQRLRKAIPPGAGRFEPRTWLRVSLPILMVGGFYALLTHTDILILQHFRSPEDVSLYYVAAKTLALVSFVNFSVAAATAHRFSEYYIAGDHERLSRFMASSIRWTFVPSLAAIALILAAGPFLLQLFGAEYSAGYPLMVVLAVGPLARAAVGPAERLLNMTGHQRACVVAYAVAFGVNLVLGSVLVMRLGIFGAAIATSAALVSEAGLLFVLVRRTLGVRAFVSFRPPRRFVSDGDETVAAQAAR